MATARTFPEAIDDALQDGLQADTNFGFDDQSDPTGWLRLSAGIAAANRNGEQPQEGIDTMSLTATAKSRTIYTVPSGTHVGRCYAVVDLGTQDDTFNNKPRLVHKVRISWEIPALRIKFEDGGEKPASVHKKYTLSLSEKANLRHDLESWRSQTFTDAELKGFKLNKLLGAPVLLGVTHKPNPKGGVYVNVTSFGKLIAGMTCPPAENPAVFFEVEMGQNDVFKDLPEFLQEEIKKCAEWRKSEEAEAPADEGQGGDGAPVGAGEGDGLDNIPF